MVHCAFKHIFFTVTGEKVIFKVNLLEGTENELKHKLRMH